MRALKITAGVIIGGLGYHAITQAMGDAGAAWIVIAIYVAFMIERTGRKTNDHF